MRQLRRAVIVVSIAASAVGVSTPRAAASERAQIVAVDSSAHPEVTLTVEPPESLAGVDLPADAFALTENGEPVDVVVERTSERAVEEREHLNIVLVFDTSGSMQGQPLGAAKAAAQAFLAQLPEGTHIGVVPFGDTPSLGVETGADAATASAFVGRLEARGETALYDALLLGLRQLGTEEGARDALVVLSDGGDTVSAATLETTTTALQGASVDFAAVALTSPEYDPAVLEGLASAAGGQVFSSGDPAQLSALFDDVAANLLNRYAVTYTSRTGGETQVALTVQWEGTVSTADRTVRLPGTAGADVTASGRPAVADGPGWLGSTQALMLGLGLMFAVMAFLLGWIFLRPREGRVNVRMSMGARFGRRGGNARLPGISEVAERAARFAERRLQRSGREGALYAALERAGVNLRPGEFLVVAVVGGLTVLALGAMVGGPIVGVAVGAAVAIAGPVALRYKGRARQAQFADQLADTLQLLTGSLRAGHSILQAMDSVADDAPSPTREEFQRLVVETRLGRDLPEALRAMHARMGSEDFLWFVQALEIHREVGGDLAEILDTVARTIRERSRLRRQVRTLSAEGRLSAVILFFLPIGVALIVSLMNPGYFAPLFDTGIGLGVVGIAVTLMTVGFFWLRKMVRLEF